MSYNPKIHHRKSIRIQGYDYSQEGLYFITICTHNRECLFGNVGVQNGGVQNIGVQNLEPLHEPQPIWQRNYHEHIIRNEKSYQTILGCYL